MKKPSQAAAVFGAIVLAAAVTVGVFTVSAASGDQTDPLVTLSYLTEVVTPTLMNKVDEQVAANEKDLVDQFNTAIDGYSQQMEDLLSKGTEVGLSFESVTVPSGQALYLQAGCEVLLRSGNAEVSAESSSNLLDTTAGSSLSSGGALEPNHLYVAAQEDGTVSVASSAQFLVRGGYSIR